MGCRVVQKSGNVCVKTDVRGDQKLVISCNILNKEVSLGVNLITKSNHTNVCLCKCVRYLISWFSL